MSPSDSDIIEKVLAHERATQKNNRLLIVAILTALGAGGVTVGKGYLDFGSDDQVNTVIAEHMIKAETQRQQAEKERDRLTRSVDELQVIVAGLRATVELTVRTRPAKEAIKSVHVPQPIETMADEPADEPPQSVQSLKAKLFQNNKP